MQRVAVLVVHGTLAGLSSSSAIDTPLDAAQRVDSVFRRLGLARQPRMRHRGRAKWPYGALEDGVGPVAELEASEKDELFELSE